MQDTRSAPTQDSPAPDVRAREVEEQMTDDERFSMVISVLGAVPLIGVVSDKRIPEGTAMSAGYIRPESRALAYRRCRAATPAWALPTPATGPTTRAPWRCLHP